MTRTKSTAVVATMCAALVLAYFFFSATPRLEPTSTSQRSSTGPSNGGASTDLRELADQLNTISENQHSLLERMTELEQLIADLDQSVIQQSADSRDRPVRLSAEERMLAKEQRNVRQRVFLESSLTNNSAHDPWSASTTTNVQQLFAQTDNLRGAENLGVSCANDMCKIEMTLPKTLDADEGMLLQLTMLKELGTTLPRSRVFSEYLPDGSTRNTYFMSRQGYQLPTEATGSNSPLTQKAE